MKTHETNNIYIVVATIAVCLTIFLLILQPYAPSSKLVRAVSLPKHASSITHRTQRSTHIYDKNGGLISDVSRKKFHYPSGGILSEVNLVSGEKDGIQKIYAPDGSQIDETIYINGQIANITGTLNLSANQKKNSHAVEITTLPPVVSLIGVDTGRKIECDTQSDKVNMHQVNDSNKIVAFIEQIPGLALSKLVKNRMRFDLRHEYFKTRKVGLKKKWWIRRGRVISGMTKEEVAITFGPPDSIIATGENGNLYEAWHYQAYPDESLPQFDAYYKKYYFDNDRLIKWD
ncbi:MAG: hypothetical protein GY858_04900 [Candidatus Omnitrophica bacterium]|nr:hypothetical protein [Candidatus Omnitrophota bacterium]